MLVSTLVSIHFVSPRLQHIMKTNFIKIQIVDLEIMLKGLRLVFPQHFVHDFQEKYFSCSSIKVGPSPSKKLFYLLQ